MNLIVRIIELQGHSQDFRKGGINARTACENFEPKAMPNN